MRVSNVERKTLTLIRVRVTLCSLTTASVVAFVDAGSLHTILPFEALSTHRTRGVRQACSSRPRISNGSFKAVTDSMTRGTHDALSIVCAEDSVTGCVFLPKSKKSKAGSRLLDLT